jgi:hypothetical protein
VRGVAGLVGIRGANDDRVPPLVRGPPWVRRPSEDVRPWLDEPKPHRHRWPTGDPTDRVPRRRAGGEVQVTIERVEYDALSVAREMRAVGLPDELADKLVAAA